MSDLPDLSDRLCKQVFKTIVMKAFLDEWMNREELSEEHKAEAPELLDSDLPNEVYIPPDCQNTEESIRACVDAQRIRTPAG